MVEYLAAQVITQPLKVIQVIQLIVEKDQEAVRHLTWQAETRSILLVSLQSDVGEVKEVARDVLNRLVAQGYTEFYQEFKDLLL